MKNLFFTKKYTRHALDIILIAVLYIVTARLGQLLSIPPGNVTPIWIPSGIILAYVLIRGYWVWPGIFIGAFVGNVWAYIDLSNFNNVFESILSGLFNGTGDSLCALVGAYLLKSIAEPAHLFRKEIYVIKFILYGAFLGGLISAVFGVSGLAISGFISWTDYLSVLQTWWIGDAVGVIILTPLLIFWKDLKNWKTLCSTRSWELLIYTLVVLSFSAISLNIIQLPVEIEFPFFMLVPLLMLAVFRFPEIITFASIVLISSIVIVSTALSIGPFAGGDLNSSLLELQLFLSTVSITIYILLANVSDRRNMESKLLESKDYNRALFSELDLGLALCDMDGRLIDINSKYAEIIGRDIEETKSLTYWEITPKKYAEQESEQLTSLTNNGSYGPYIKEYIHKRGHLIPVKLQGTILKINGKNHIWSSVEDISEQRSAENKLRSTELRYKVLFNKAADGIIITNKKGEIQEFNQTAEALFGYKKEEVLKQHFKILISPQSNDNNDQFIQDILDTSNFDDFIGGREIFGLNKKGQQFPLNIAISRNIESNVAHLIAIVRDLSEEKEAQNKLEQAKAEAIEANMAKSQFLSSMSHELRTPLNAILGFSQLLDMDSHNLHEQQSQAVKEIYRGGTHLLSLIEDILDLSKIESGKLNVIMDKVPLKPVIEECENLILSMLKDRNITLHTNDASAYTVQCDPLRLKQIILNLLSNAIKYNRENGNVYLTFSEENGSIRINIEDTGYGLTQNQIDKIFEPFERAGAENLNIDGTGIGLVICKNLAEAMHGKIGISSEPGKGSMFWLELLSSDSKVSDGRKPLTSTESGSNNIKPELKTKKIKVLCIEDNQANLKLIENIFNIYSDEFDLASTTKPEEGITMAFRDKPDVILSDIKMPGINGYEIAKKIKQNFTTKSIPLIAISANAHSQEIDKAIASGFDAYLTKPLKIESLVSKIHELLEQKT